MHGVVVGKNRDARAGTGESLGDGVAIGFQLVCQLDCLGFGAHEHDDGVELFYFAAFDETWKVDKEGDVGAFWGIWDADGKLKYG